MRARRLPSTIVATIALVALGACGSGSGSSDPMPSSSTVATQTDSGTPLTDEMLEKICANWDPEVKKVPVTDADAGNGYAAVVQGLARSLGQQCEDRKKP